MEKNNKYPLFAQWYKITDWLLTTTEAMPVKIRYSISNRIITLTMDNVEMITEAIYRKSKHGVLNKINLNIEKLRILLRICCDRRYISEKQFIYICEQLNTAGKMCGGWIKSLKHENI